MESKLETWMEEVVLLGQGPDLEMDALNRQKLFTFKILYHSIDLIWHFWTLLRVYKCKLTDNLGWVRATYIRREKSGAFIDAHLPTTDTSFPFRMYYMKVDYRLWNFIPPPQLPFQM